MLVFEMAKQVELSIRCVVKDYHECPFEVNIEENFYAFKKRGERGNAFKVTNDRGQLGHLQIELVSPLGPYTKRLLCKFEKKLIEMCRLNPQYY